MDLNNSIHSLEKDLIDMWSNQGFVLYINLGHTSALEFFLILNNNLSEIMLI